MIKLVVVILLLAWGWSTGGWGGLMGMLFLMTIVLAPIAYRPKPQESPSRPQEDEPWQETTGVRKGQRSDPTRPNEDAAGMITNNYGRRRL